MTELGNQIVCPVGDLPRDETVAYTLVVAVDGSARNEIENQVALATTGRTRRRGRQFTGR
jgi:hypothetical protein